MADKILVADDEDYLRDMLGTALRFAGFDVALGKDGFDAIRQAQDLNPDLVLLDVMMPGIDGLEVCRGMRDDNDDTPVIFLTALDEESGDLIDLSPTEYKLLRYLMLNPERVLSKAQILDQVWHYDFDGDGSVVESFIS